MVYELVTVEGNICSVHAHTHTSRVGTFADMLGSPSSRGLFSPVSLVVEECACCGAVLLAPEPASTGSSSSESSSTITAPEPVRARLRRITGSSSSESSITTTVESVTFSPSDEDAPPTPLRCMCRTMISSGSTGRGARLEVTLKASSSPCSFLSTPTSACAVGAA